METVLNDLSLRSTNNDMGHWNVFIKFYELIEFLRRFGYSKVLCEKNVHNSEICGIRIADSFLISFQDKIVSERRKLIASLYQNVFSKQLDFADDFKPFRIEANGLESKSLAKAVYDALPAVSFTFDDCYASTPLYGSLHGVTKTCANLYASDQNGLLASLVPLKDCKKLNPERNPLWNKKMTEAYLGSFQPRTSFLDANEKMAYIREHCTQVALLNGWVVQKDLSKLNSSAGQKRIIFYSDAFLHQNTYLSIDWEHPDLRFEMCDKRGNHLGELQVKTGKMGEPDFGHNIKVH